MELELGLALSVSSVHFPNKSFDLNINKNALQLQEQQQQQQPKDLIEFKNLMITQKRSFSEAFREDKTLSLLVWNGRQPNDDEDGEEQEREPFSPLDIKNDEDDHDQIVGWPPIKSWRKKFLRGGRQERALERAGVRNSVFVKVKMEGVIIGRKIDLTLFDSYQALTNAVLNMFAKYRNGDEDDGPYILSYLDKEGDWLLAGDVPWQIFVESVQRIELLKRRS
ncbi:auxin-responsive protein IAA5-like [Coffea arabica]|uniref:Auxin-responsive protein n=1 Tax=Coffea arabica TaxID=13443 RepID=A0A6P6TPQ1_COFAR